MMVPGGQEWREKRNHANEGGKPVLSYLYIRLAAEVFILPPISLSLFPSTPIFFIPRPFPLLVVAERTFQLAGFAWRLRGRGTRELAAGRRNKRYS